MIVTGERRRKGEGMKHDVQNRERSTGKIVASLVFVGNRVEMSVKPTG